MLDDTINQSVRTNLEEIDSEINELKLKRAALEKRWIREKSVIHLIRSSKAKIEEFKHLAEDLERKGELGKVAELRYGSIPDLQKAISGANDKLNDIQKDGKLLKEEVDAEDIAEIVAKWTGIPVSKMLESERSKLLKMEDRIHDRLVNQTQAVSAVSNAIRRSRAGLQDAAKPMGSFIFIGSTGIGKTELARALAEFLFDNENALIRIDMSEYMEKFSVSRLIGAPPGYIGYESGGQLTEAVRVRPYSVILLDEIEKAHSDVINVLLQVLDDGRLTDGKGRTVNFKNTIIIMTSNIGAELLQEKLADINDENRDAIIREMRVRITALLRKTLRPEFLNRIDDIVLFKPLLKSEIIQITNLQLEKLKKKLSDKNLKFSISQDAVEWLAQIGFDPQFGARPVKRAIQKHITDQLASKILEGEYFPGDTVKINVNTNGGFIFSK
ncbi:MAG: AAA family ATPase [Candidatus Kapabacteria bacterium]|nr:AAA family ATPase [Candidatus Kapabacteria bacterium]